MSANTASQAIDFDNLPYTAGQFQFHGAGVDTVAKKVKRAILPVFLSDATGSIKGDEALVRSMLTRSVMEMKAKGVHEGAYIGAWDFSSDYLNDLLEIIPFTGIDDVDIKAIPALVAGGWTPMYGAAFNALSAANVYGKALDEAGVTTDLFFVLVTDGRPEGPQTKTAADVRKLLEEIRDPKAEIRVASAYVAVIGIGSEFNKDAQQAFADDIGADAYFFAGDLSGGTIGKIIGWFSSSIAMSQKTGASVATNFGTD